jgi:hypothetical protein
MRIISKQVWNQPTSVESGEMLTGLSLTCNYKWMPGLACLGRKPGQDIKFFHQLFCSAVQWFTVTGQSNSMNLPWPRYKKGSLLAQLILQCSRQATLWIYRGPVIEGEPVGPVDVWLGKEREVGNEPIPWADMLQSVHYLHWWPRL